MHFVGYLCIMDLTNAQKTELNYNIDILPPAEVT